METTSDTPRYFADLEGILNREVHVNSIVLHGREARVFNAVSLVHHFATQIMDMLGDERPNYSWTPYFAYAREMYALSLIVNHELDEWSQE